MGCCIRNCYGIELNDVKDRVKLKIPRLLLDFLLDLSKCTNSESQRNGLANWNQLNIFTAKKIFEKINELDRNNGYLDLSSPEKIFNAILEGLINEFNALMCNGGSQGLLDLDKKYNSDKDGNNLGNLFPHDLSDSDKNHIKDLIDNNGNFNDNVNGGNGNNNFIIIDRDNTNLGDDLFGNGGNGSGFGNGNGSGNNNGNGNGFGDGYGNGGNGNGSGGGNGGGGNGNGNGNGDINGNGNGNGNNGDDIFGNGNGNGSGNGGGVNNGNGNNGNGTNNSNGPLDNIPNDEIENLNLSKTIYKCFTPVFHIENYIFNPEGFQNPIFLTKARVRNLKRLHNEILLPIFHHYFGEDALPSCQIRITFGLASYHSIVTSIGGNAFSKHLTGEAVDFSIVGMDAWKFVEDVKSKVLDVPFGVLYTKGDIHITLPFTYEKLNVSRLYLSSPKKDINSLEVEFF